MFSTSNMEGAMLGLTWVTLWAVFVLILIHMKNRKRQKTLELIHKERMAALDKGVPPPEWPDYNGTGLNGEGAGWGAGPKAQLGTGGLLLMLGIGTCVSFAILPERDVQQFWPLGLVLVFLGLGYGLRYLLTKGPKA